MLLLLLLFDVLCCVCLRCRCHRRRPLYPDYPDIDHIIADERHLPLCEYFPNVHMGFMIHSVNGHNLSKMTFDECMAFIKRARGPHKVDFRRYDYRYDPLEDVWRTLAQVREMGTYVEDPLLTYSAFVQAASTGDLVTLRRLLQQGEDPDSIDYTGVSAFHAAATNGHLKACEMLLKAGAKIDKRDINVSNDTRSQAMTSNDAMLFISFLNAFLVLHIPVITLNSMINS